jgi:hypothetical protein
VSYTGVVEGFCHDLSDQPFSRAMFAHLSSDSSSPFISEQKTMMFETRSALEFFDPIPLPSRCCGMSVSSVAPQW